MDTDGCHTARCRRPPPACEDQETTLLWITSSSDHIVRSSFRRKARQASVDRMNMNTVEHRRSGLMTQANGRRTETTQVRLLRIQAETLIRCRELQARAASPLIFALSTALKLLCIDVPNELNHDELVVVADSQKTRRRIAGVRCVYWSYPTRLVHLEGITCVAPDTTWLMYARRSRLESLVLLGDAFMRRDSDQRWMTLRDFRDSCHATHEQIRKAKRRMPAGTVNSRRAMVLMRENTDSVRESELRLMLLSYGLPMPQVNPHVDIGNDTGQTNVGGRRRFFLDLAYSECKVAVEYDGKQHASNWEEDVRRRTLLEDAGWMCVNVTWNDMRSDVERRALAVSVASRLERRSGRKHAVTGPIPLRRLASRLLRIDKEADDSMTEKADAHG